MCASGLNVEEQKTFNKENADHLCTLDHIVSQKELAATSYDDADFAAKRRDPVNLVVACNHCNSRKQHMTVYQFCRRYGFDYATILRRIAERIEKAI
jgi:5-methylcytosine-specific restriction endonuclease McrA